MLPPVHILIIPGLTMPDVADEMLERMAGAAGAGTTITVAESRGEALEAAVDAEVILGRIDPQLFAAAKRLQWVHAITAGADAYLFREMRDSEVQLSGDKGLVGSHLAEHTFALLLSITRRLADAIVDGPASWEHRVEYRRAEFELEGLTMGIVGFGGTGKAIARRAAAFGMRCQAVDRDAVQPTPDVPAVLGPEALDELLASSDVVASGLPLTEETRGLFDAHAFELMKPTTIFVNVTRGEVVDGDALVDAMRSGQIAGAGLDVAPQEPLPPDHPLWSIPNVEHSQRRDDAPHRGSQPATARTQPRSLLPQPPAVPRGRAAGRRDRQAAWLLRSPHPPGPPAQACRRLIERR